VFREYFRRIYEKEKAARYTKKEIMKVLEKQGYRK
jgi:hypothetical protein